MTGCTRSTHEAEDHNGRRGSSRRLRTAVWLSTSTARLQPGLSRPSRHHFVRKHPATRCRLESKRRKSKCRVRRRRSSGQHVDQSYGVSSCLKGIQDRHGTPLGDAGNAGRSIAARRLRSRLAMRYSSFYYAGQLLCDEPLGLCNVPPAAIDTESQNLGLWH